MISTAKQDRSTSDLLDIREAAEFLRVSETSLRRWTNAGRLPCLRIGGRRERRFRRADLLAFIGLADRAAPSTPGKHFLALYTSDRGRVEGAAAFLTAGLESQALCLLAAEQDVQRAVIAELEYGRPAVRRELKARRLVVAEYHATATAQLEYWRVHIGSALKAGVSRVYIAGDLSAGALSLIPFAEILEYEAEYGRSIARPFPVTTLCQYDARKISGLDVVGLLECHDAPLH